MAAAPLSTICLASHFARSSSHTGRSTHTLLFIPTRAGLCVLLTAWAAQAEDIGGIDEVERGLVMQKVCFGDESPVVAASAKLLEKLRTSLARS